MAKEAKARLAGGSLFKAGETPTIGLTVRWVPAGPFTIESPMSEQGPDMGNARHEVTITRGFFMAEAESTQGQRQIVIGSNRSHFKGTDRPVEQVTWEDAVESCRKLTARQRVDGLLPEGWEWRLPTEAEWE